MWIEKAQRCQPVNQINQKEYHCCLHLKGIKFYTISMENGYMSSFSKTSIYVLTDRKYIFSYYYILQFIFHLFLPLYLIFFPISFLFFFPHTFPRNWISRSRSFHWTRNNFSLHQKIKAKPKCPYFDLNDPILSRLFQIQRNFKAIIKNKTRVSDTEVKAGFELLP